MCFLLSVVFRFSLVMLNHKFIYKIALELNKGKINEGKKKTNGRGVKKWRQVEEGTGQWRICLPYKVYP